MSLVLGLGGPYYHDGSACLVSAGEIVAFVEEERFTRLKHNTRSRSCAMSAAYCLSTGGIRLEDVDEVAISWNPVWPESAEYIEDDQLIAKLLGEVDLGKLPERWTWRWAALLSTTAGAGNACTPSFQASLLAAIPFVSDHRPGIELDARYARQSSTTTVWSPPGRRRHHPRSRGTSP